MKDPLKIHRIIASVAVVFFIGLNIYLFSDQTRYSDVKINTWRGSFSVKAELALTMREQQKGLMYRNHLKVGEGMLFVFKNTQTVTFWMKNTLIPLDIMFIGEDMEIKYISEKTPPCENPENCPLYSSGEPVKYVLEVPGGYSKLFGVKKGDNIEITDED